MTLITFQDGQPVMRDGKIGTEQECCCNCTCGIGCTQEISITFVRGGINETITAAPDGFNSAQGFDNTSFALIELSSSCGKLGPNGECGWIVEVYFCGCDAVPGNPFGCDAFSGTFQAFVPVDNDGCPDVGDLTFECIGGDCDPTVTGSVAA